MITTDDDHANSGGLLCSLLSKYCFSKVPDGVAALLSCRCWDGVGTKVAAVGTCASRGVKLHQNYNPDELEEKGNLKYTCSINSARNEAPKDTSTGQLPLGENVTCAKKLFSYP